MNNIMEQVKIRRWSRIARARGFMRCAGVAALFATSGCAAFNSEGFEFGAKLGMYSVNERSESSRTIASPCRGLKALIVGCGIAPASEVPHGS